MPNAVRYAWGSFAGSLITADSALEQGKEVFALPGPVTSPFSQGCHQLIRQGAGILIDPESFLEDLGYEKKEKLDKMQKVLETKEFLLYSFLDFVPKSPEQLIKESGLSAREVMEQLISLELDGRIREVSRNQYIRCDLSPA